MTDSVLMLFPQSIWLEEEDAAREAAENHVTQHVNLSFPESNSRSFLILIASPSHCLPALFHADFFRYFRTSPNFSGMNQVSLSIFSITEASEFAGFIFFFSHFHTLYTLGLLRVLYFVRLITTILEGGS